MISHKLIRSNTKDTELKMKPRCERHEKSVRSSSVTHLNANDGAQVYGFDKSRVRIHCGDGDVNESQRKISFKMD